MKKRCICMRLLFERDSTETHAQFKLKTMDNIDMSIFLFRFEDERFLGNRHIRVSIAECKML